MGCAHSTPGNGSDQFSNWTASDAANSSPCPFVNALANHGVIPRTGITADSLKAALGTFQLDDALQKLFTGPAVTNLGADVEGQKQLTLSQLGQHNAIEHDASLTRQDAALGDHVKFDPELLTKLIELSSDGQYITQAHLGHYRAIREEHSKTNNKEYTFDLKQQFLAYAEAALLLIALRDSTGNIPINWLKMVYEQEKLPFELGWTIRPISLEEVISVAGDLRGEKFEPSVVEQFY